MKTSFGRIRFLLLVLVSAWLLGGCYYDPYGANPPGGNYGGGGYYGGGGGGYGPGPGSGAAYNTGMNYGRQDGRRGLSRQASRHWHVVSPAERETFAQGYNVGFQQGGGQTPGQDAYNQGVRYGAADARRGLPRQASRHWSVVQGPYRQSFAQGYNAGYLRN